MLTKCVLAFGCCFLLHHGELYKAGEVSLPTPEELLGDYIKPQNEWPKNDDADRRPCMRETQAHSDLLFLFLEDVVITECFRRYATTKNLSAYMHFSLEGYLVLTYVNGYKSWKSEVDNSSGGTDQEATALLFTAKSREKGKYKGWSTEGIMLYNQLCLIAKQQREDKDNVTLAAFDNILLERFQQLRADGAIGASMNGPVHTQVIAMNFLSTIDHPGETV